MIRAPNFFEKNQVEIIDKALSYTKELMRGYYTTIARLVDQRDQKPIWDECDNEIQQIDDTKKFFKENENRKVILTKKDEFDLHMDTIASSLVAYRKYLGQIQRSTGVSQYGEIVKMVDVILSLGGLKVAKKDNYEKYYQAQAKAKSQRTIKKTNFFISYQDKDHEKACKLKTLLVGSSKLSEDDVFVAHRDIPLSKIWREDIIKHLQICTHLIAVCTENYKTSAYGNQEVGYAMARENVDIIPLFWESTKKEHFGFIESFQALLGVKEENLEKVVEDIWKRVFGAE
jgi:hypothetical protein